MTDTLSDTSRPRQQRRRAAGFTLIELLVVIGIIMILIAILVPVISKMRIHAQTAATQSTMNRIAQSINVYLADFNAYPGMMTNKFFSDRALPGTVTLSGIPKATYTQTEDCAMALTGGWRPTFSSPNVTLTFTPSDLGSGPTSYNPLPTAAKRYNAYMEYRPADFSPPDAQGNPTPLSTHAELALDYCKDTAAPEFMDNYSQQRPIIYVRANSIATPGANSAVADNYDPNVSYDFSQVKPYLKTTSGANADFGGSTSAGSDAVLQKFRSSTGIGAVNAGSYILLDAGPDRLFGTPDDILVGAGGAQ
jgi:type II secretory pathway pseudopilin PulG